MQQLSDRLKQIAKMLEENPEDNFLNYAAALEYKKRGDRERALKLLQSIIDRDPDYLPVYFQLGKIQEELGHQEEALAVYKAGAVVADDQEETKTKQELEEAVWLLEE